MDASKRNQAGFGIITLAILLAAIVGAFLVGQHVYSARKAAQSVVDYAQCIKQRGAKLLQTYPEQCVFDGKTFTNLQAELQGKH